jgi:hypothetical protein
MMLGRKYRKEKLIECYGAEYRGRQLVFDIGRRAHFRARQVINILRRRLIRWLRRSARLRVRRRCRAGLSVVHT